MDTLTGQEAITRQIAVTIDTIKLEGDLAIPSNASGLVLFAHGSGSSRHSARNQFVARELRKAGLGTLLFDLLTRDEEAVDWHTGHLRFDMTLLAERLTATANWVFAQPFGSLPLGLFGSSTGGGAALMTAAGLGQRIGAVVSRGGRPDLAGPALERVNSPTLLIVGGNDDAVIRINEEALTNLQCDKELAIVPGAGHLFEETGTLEQVAKLAADWFTGHLRDQD